MNMPVQSAVSEEDIVTEPIQIPRQDVSVQQARQDSFPASDIKFILWGSVLSLYFLASPIYLSWYAWYLWRGYWIWAPVALIVISGLVIFFFSGNAVPKWKVTRWYTTIMGTLSSCLPTVGIWLAVSVHALPASIYGAIAIAAGIVLAIIFLIGSLFSRCYLINNRAFF